MCPLPPQYKLAYNPIEVEFIAIAMPKKVENKFLQKKTSKYLS